MIIRNTMFQNYQSLDNYTPQNNIPPKLGDIDAKIPMGDYNAHGELVGYNWKCGDSIVLEWEITGSVEYTDELAGPVILSPAEYLDGKTIVIRLYNFRQEVIYEDSTDAGETVKFFIDENISKEILPGIYYISLSIVDEDSQTYYTLFDIGDCTLRVR